MKYFTSEWWSGGCENTERVLEQYRNHISSIRNLLPQSALDLDAKHTLHDSEVKSIINDFANGEARLTLHGWDTAFQVKTRYFLTFSGVVLFDQLFPPDEYIESELGDLGYWEWSTTPEGTEIQMLFASSATFRIVFKAFSFCHEAVQA
jgi:hypothetical protein